MGDLKLGRPSLVEVSLSRPTQTLPDVRTFLIVVGREDIGNRT